MLLVVTYGMHSMSCADRYASPRLSASPRPTKVLLWAEYRYHRSLDSDRDALKALERMAFEWLDATIEFGLNYFFLARRGIC